jgi:hypothetical protein
VPSFFGDSKGEVCLFEKKTKKKQNLQPKRKSIFFGLSVYKFDNFEEMILFNKKEKGEKEEKKKKKKE